MPSIEAVRFRFGVTPATSKRQRGRRHGDWRWYVKRRAVRALRRCGRADPENAPTAIRHITRGWAD